MYNFPVQLQEVFLKDGKAIPDARVVVRTDTGEPIGKVVTDKYTLFTHDDAIKKTTAFLENFGPAKVVSHLERNGARFMQSYTFSHHSIEVKGVKGVGDVVRLELVVANSYGLGSSVSIKLCARVLRCMNGMTMPFGEISLNFKHVGELLDLALPDPQVVLNLFDEAGKEWQEWAEREASFEQQEFIAENAVKLQIISKRTYDKDELGLLKPEIGRTFWSYYNNFTEMLTHHMPKVQQSSRLRRFDKLNSVFKAAATGQSEELVVEAETVE